MELRDIETGAGLRKVIPVNPTDSEGVRQKGIFRCVGDGNLIAHGQAVELRELLADQALVWLLESPPLYNRAAAVSKVLADMRVEVAFTLALGDMSSAPERPALPPIVPPSASKS